MKKLLTVILFTVLLTVSSQGLAGGIISMNFVENATNQIFTPDQPAGPLGTLGANWNHNSALGSPWASNSMSGLIDDTGAVTTAGITWQSSNTWWTYEGTGTNENKLAVGYLDDGSTSTGVGVVVTINDIPYTLYRVYGLISSDQNQDATPPTFPGRNFTVNGAWVYGGDATTTATVYGRSDRNFAANGESWTRIEPGVTIGNYWTIETSGSTLTISGLPRDGSSRGCLTAVIIEEIDPLIAVNYDPEYGTEVGLDQILSWEQRAEAEGLGITYDVYFGTDSNSLSPSYYGNNLVKTSTSDPLDFFYAPALANSTTYYWRVDAIEPNNVAPFVPAVHPGPEMMFSTIPPNALVTVNPVSQTVAAGTDVQLTVTGINVATYQWYKDGVALTDGGSISGSAAGTLTITNIQVADEGFYHCEVDNSLLEPDASTAAQVMTQRLAGWWKLDGDLTDAVATVVAGAPTHDGTSLDPNFVGIGKDGGALEFFGDEDSLVVINDSADYFNFFPQGMTVSVWIKTAHDGWDGYLSKHGDGRGWTLDLYSGRQDTHFTVRGSHGDLWGSDDDGNLYDETWHLVTAVIDRTTQTSRVYVDGLLRGQSGTYAKPQTSATALIFGAEGDAGTTLINNTVIDDVRIWTYPLDDEAIALLYTDFNPGVWLCTDRPLLDTTGPNGVPDCKVNLFEFLEVAELWLECGRWPASYCD